MESLQAGDEQAFRGLVQKNYGSMLRLALTVIGNRSVAEDVVQETWLGVLRGLSGFEGRSSLKTWIYRILMNRARSAVTGESRRKALFSEQDAVFPETEPSVPAGQFTAEGKWIQSPSNWASSPESQLLSKETQEVLAQAASALPAAQRAVLQLHDVEGFRSEEICDILALSSANQRVLLHRARSKVRKALAKHEEGVK
ncbi:MAG: sigma-70 family RNA polymerase sigma factor [Acidobacteria bacterium]|nr:sigma-70 family RNA polymerase sigma factor [Acidobacteriota bacterium]MDA1236035.1 sigma-70 family RNA polymerase sigma factor [Acidobacteriota bacterium]